MTRQPTDLNRHYVTCGVPTTWFVHVVSCSRCGRIYDKYSGYEVSKVDGDFGPSRHPAERVYRDEAGNVAQVGLVKMDHIPVAQPPRRRLSWWQRLRFRLSVAWARRFPSPTS